MKFGLRNVSFVYPEARRGISSEARRGISSEARRGISPEARRGNLWDNVKAHARRAERDGFASLWVMDHFLQLPSHGPLDEPFLDAWTVLPALAAVTDRLRLGTMVSPVGYRNPALLAKMVATIDHISQGRFNFGFGAGGYEPEYRRYGFAFNPRAAARLRQMEEALRLMIALWTEARVTFHGRTFHVENAILEPKPWQKPYPPILIGGAGPKITLRIVAELGDACNLWGPPAEFARQRAILQEHCQRVGRDEATIEKTVYDLVVCAATEAEVQRKLPRLLPEGYQEWMALVGTPAQLVDTIGRYQAVGADHLTVDIAGNDPESYDLFVREVMPHFQDDRP